MTDKLGILDIVATLNNGIKVNIEMQVKDYHNTVDRSVFTNMVYFTKILIKMRIICKFPNQLEYGF